MRAGLTAASVARALTTPIVSNWIPVTRVSLLAAYAAYGEDPGRHLLTGVALHAASSVLLLVLLGMTGACWRSAFVAAVFGLHPLHVENVAWFSDRQDLMSGFFFMLLLGAWSGYAKAPSAGRYCVALLCLALGLLSKPMLVSAPFVLLLLDWPLGRLTPDGASGELDRGRVRRAVLEKLPMLALVAVISAVSLRTQSEIGALADTELFPVSVRVSNALAAYVAYVQTAFWPSVLAIYYPYPRNPISVLRAAACAAALLAASLLLLWNAKRPALLVGWLWFLGMLVPVIGLVQIRAEARADRYMYLPLIGLAITTAWGASEALGHGRANGTALASAAAVAVLAMAVVSWHQVGTWHDAIALDEHAVRVTTNNFRAVSDLAEALRRKGRLPEARAQLQEALDLRPNDARMHIGLAELYFNAGRLFEAIRWYESGLRLDPLHMTLKDAQGVYSGAEGRLWALVMGEQIHAGGFNSSMELATRAGIKAGWRGVDLCCALGAGCRFLAGNFKAVMCGVDGTPHILVEEARKRAPLAEWGIEFKLADVLDIPYAAGTFDFVWGEDAWCYVTDKDKLVAEAARVLKPGGTIAFTDWVEGPAGLTEAEALRFNTFMKFPDMQSISGYRGLLMKHGFEIREAAQIEFGKYVRSLPEHADRTIDLRRPANHRQRHGRLTRTWRRDGRHAAEGARRQDHPRTLHRDQEGPLTSGHPDLRAGPPRRPPDLRWPGERCAPLSRERSRTRSAWPRPASSRPGARPPNPAARPSLAPAPAPGASPVSVRRSGSPRIGAATCDQMRRALELAGRTAGKPSLIIHAPKTRSPEAEDFFVTEVRWLAGEIEKAAGRRLDKEALRRAIAVRNGLRGRLRLLREGLTGADFSALIYLEARLQAVEMNAFLVSFRPVPSPRPAFPRFWPGAR